MLYHRNFICECKTIDDVFPYTYFFIAIIMVMEKIIICMKNDKNALKIIKFSHIILRLRFNFNSIILFPCFAYQIRKA